MKYQAVELAKLINGGSIDDKYGRPLVKLIYLRPRFASLESLGKIHENNIVYEKRLNELFNTIGTPKHLYFMGYSKGANTALEFLNHLSRSPSKAWAENLEALSH